MSAGFPKNKYPPQIVAVQRQAANKMVAITSDQKHTTLHVVWGSTSEVTSTEVTFEWYTHQHWQ